MAKKRPSSRVRVREFGAAFGAGYFNSIPAEQYLPLWMSAIPVDTDPRLRDDLRWHIEQLRRCRDNYTNGPLQEIEQHIQAVMNIQRDIFFEGHTSGFVQFGISLRQFRQECRDEQCPNTSKIAGDIVSLDATAFDHSPMLKALSQLLGDQRDIASRLRQLARDSGTPEDSTLGGAISAVALKVMNELLATESAPIEVKQKQPSNRWADEECPYKNWHMLHGHHKLRSLCMWYGHNEKTVASHHTHQVWVQKLTGQNFQMWIAAEDAYKRVVAAMTSDCR